MHSIICGVPKCLMSILTIPLKLLVVISDDVKSVACSYHDLRAVAFVFL